MKFRSLSRRVLRDPRRQAPIHPHRHDVEHNLATYVAIVTVINGALGTIVAAGAWLLGLPSPLILGILAMALNYIPYVGPACMAIILFAVGFVNFSSLGQAFIAPASLIVLTTIEGHLITPTVLGRSLTPRSARGLSRHQHSGPGCGGRWERSLRFRYWSSRWSSSVTFSLRTTSSCPDDRELFSASMVVLQTDFPQSFPRSGDHPHVEHVQHGSRHGR